MKNLWKHLFVKAGASGYFRGFTMMEILISCVVIGVLAVLLIPTLQSAKPDKNEALHKKSTFIVERVVNELSSDSYLYPNNGEYSSLSNTDNVQYNDETHGGNTKFCTLFASRLKLKPGSEINCKKDELSFTSEDGIDWYLPVSDFKDGAETLTVDVNGSEGPNLVGEDRFEYKIQPGFKIPKKEIDKTTITDTPEAPRKESPTGGQTVNPETKPSQPKYTISCEVTGGEAGILGAGGNKVNGNYTLVAVPEPGYKCNWFTKQVTVKGADVTDCALTCEPDTLRPAAEGDTNISEIPSGDDDDDDDDDDYCEEHPEDLERCVCPNNPDDPRCKEEEETYCASVNWGGSSEYCSDSGKVCGKAGDLYSITISSDDKNYTAVWTQGKGSGTFGNSNVVLSASCDPKNQCYDLNITGDANCPFVLPAANCPYPGQETKYTAGTYNVTVTPKEGYTFNGKEGTVSYPVTVNGTNSKVDLSSLCKKASNETKLEIDWAGNSCYAIKGSVNLVPGGLSGFSYGSETESSGTTTYDIEPGTYTVTGNCSGRETEKSIWEIGHLCSITPQKITIKDGETGKVLVRSGCGDGDNPGHVTVIVNLTGVNYENFTVKTPTGTFTQITTKLDLPPGTYNFSPTGGVEFKVKDDGKNYSCNNSGTDKYSCSPYADPSTLTVEPTKNYTVNIYINVNGGGGQNCSIKFVGNGKGAANTEGTINLTGGNGTSKTVTLNKSNNYTATASGLTCGYGYSYSGTATNCYTMSFDPVSIAKLSGSQTVNVDFTLGTDCEDNNCAIKLVGEGGGLIDKVTINANLSGSATNSAVLNSGNGFTYTWSGLACKKSYSVSATAQISGTTATPNVNPSSIPSLTGTQIVKISLNDTPKDSCAIEVQGVGEIGGGVYANIKLSGGAVKSGVLNNGNSYNVLWTDLKCGKSYSVSVTKAGDTTDSNAKVTATVDRLSVTPTNNQTELVEVNFKKEEAKQCSITVIGSKPDSTLLGRPNDSIQVRVSGNGKLATLDSSNNFTYKFSGLTCGSVYTVVATPPSFDSVKISGASYKVSGFHHGTLNGDETSTLSLEVKKRAYLYIKPGPIAGAYYTWNILAFTSKDGKKNASWPFGNDVSSLTVTVFCPHANSVDKWGNPVPTQFTFTFTRSSYHQTTLPYHTPSSPPSNCSLVSPVYVDGYDIQWLY